MRKHLEGRPEVGARVGALTVLGYAEKSPRRILTRCDCGAEAEFSVYQMRTRRSCGCYAAGRPTNGGWNKLPAGEAALNAQFIAMRGKATARGKEWRLTREQFKELAQRPCVYCGAPPVPRHHTGKKLNGPAVMNTLDRVENGVGYTYDNCVPACYECNYAKHTRTTEEFLAHCKRVFEWNILHPDQ